MKMNKKFTNDFVVNKNYRCNIKHSGNVLKWSSKVADKKFVLSELGNNS